MFRRLREDSVLTGKLLCEEVLSDVAGYRELNEEEKSEVLEFTDLFNVSFAGEAYEAKEIRLCGGDRYEKLGASPKDVITMGRKCSVDELKRDLLFQIEEKVSLDSCIYCVSS